MSHPARCLTCRLHLARRRGVCDTCYQQHRLAVQAGKTTWAELLWAGLIRPALSRDEKKRRMWRAVNRQVKK